MARVLTWCRYMCARFEYAHTFRRMPWLRPYPQPTAQDEVNKTIWRKIFGEKLTFYYWNKGVGMQPLFGTKGGQLLVRKIAEPDTTTIRIGDVVVHRDPRDLDGGKFLVNRIAAIGDEWEMLSTDKDKQPISLGEDDCWVLADNKNSEEALDSQTFGTIYVTYIVGRAIYCVRSAVDHGPVKNSEHSTMIDSPVVEMELDLDEMIRMRQKEDDDTDDNDPDKEDDYMER